MPTPYIRRLRSRHFERARHSQNLSAWLTAQATRLSTSAASVFRMLRSGYSATAVNAVGTDPDLVNSVAPVISGTVGQGNTLTKSSNGTWSGLAPIVYSFQWRRNGVAIGGATGATYVIPDALPGPYTCAVTARNPAGSLTVSSNALN